MKGVATRRAVTPADIQRWPAILTQTIYTPGDVERFLARVDIRGDGECWPWTGQTMWQGYGVLGNTDASGRAHRISLVLATGDLADDLCACHHCDNPPCCNPACLFAATQKENIADMLRKGRCTPGRQTLHVWRVDTAQVVAMRRHFAQGASISQLMLAYDQTSDEVRDILRGRAFPDVGGPTFASLRRRPARQAVAA